MEVDYQEEIDSKLIRKPDQYKAEEYEEEKEEEEEDRYSFPEGSDEDEEEEEEEYPMTNNPRGKAIIFNHYEFNPILKAGKREGTNEDKSAIEKILGQEGLKFFIGSHDDMKFSEIQLTLKEGMIIIFSFN